MQRARTQKVYRAIAAAAPAFMGIMEEVKNRWKAGERLIIDFRCGAVRNFVRKLHPDLVSNLVKSNSTLFTSAKLARQQLPKHACLAFVGPDVAYKETIDYPSEGSLVNAVLTWHEFFIKCIN